MKLRKLAVLLTAWVITLVGPGILATTALGIGPGRVDWWPLLTWLLGYLLQLALFMAASQVSGKPNILAWFVASILPWVCDWTTPVVLWAAAPCTAFAGLIAWRIFRTASRANDLAVHGVPATGIILEVVKPWMNVTINNVYIKRTLRLRIQRSDGAAPYEARLKGVFMLGEIPDVGTRVSLRVDPDDPQRFESVDEPAPQDDVWSARSRPHTYAEPDRGPTASGTGVAGALAALTQLHASGGLSDAEFARAKARVLDA